MQKMCLYVRMRISVCMIMCVYLKVRVNVCVFGLWILEGNAFVY